MANALAMVKRDLGSQAVILHTRSYKRGGFFGLGAKQVVEITATDDPNLGRQRRNKKTTPATPSEKTSTTPNAGDLIRRTYAATQANLNKQQKTSQQPDPAAMLAEVASKAAIPPNSTQPTSTESSHLVEEMRAVKRMVKQMAQQQRRRVDRDAAAGRIKPDLPDKLFDQYLFLLEQQVTEELAEEVIGLVRDRLDPEQRDDESTIRQALQEVLANLIPTDQAAGKLEHTPDNRPRTIALIGPTGVGKTTTVAKLAANFKLKQKKKVALITLDTYRIAAVDQLRTYANIIGIPLHVVTTQDELAAAIQLCSNYDAVLIDTAGRSQRDDPKLEQLKSLMAIANPHEVHLVLSSTCSQAVLLDIVERFSAVRTDRIIFTKLDEAVGFGVLLNVARKVNKRLSYITTGQEVPHQIEPGCPARLAALVLGEGESC